MKPEEITSSEPNSEIAFKDFTKSISIGEFEALLQIAKREYELISNVLKHRTKFLETSMDQVMSREVEGVEIPEEFKNKLKAGFDRRTTKDLKKSFKAEFGRICHITEFINRFSTTDEQVEELDINFLKQ